jgi:hypothetical protein
MSRCAATSVFVWTPLSLVLSLISACAGMAPPARTSGPTSSQEGIQIAVLQQQCTQTQDPNQPDNEETLQIQVRNGAPTPVTIVRTEFRLMTPDGLALKTGTIGPSDPLVVNAGETRVFQLRFTTRGSLQCARELQLDASSGVVLGDKPVKLGAIRFVPSLPPSASAPNRSTELGACAKCE